MTYYVKLTLPNGADAYLKKQGMHATDKSPYMSEFKAHCAAQKAEEIFAANGMKVRATVHDWETGQMSGVAIDAAIRKAL